MVRFFYCLVSFPGCISFELRQEPLLLSIEKTGCLTGIPIMRYKKLKTKGNITPYIPGQFIYKSLTGMLPLLQRRHATKLQGAYLGKETSEKKNVGVVVVVVVDSSRNSKLPIQMAPHHLSLLKTACNELLLGGCNCNFKNGFEKQTKIESHVGLKNVPGHSRIQWVQ